MKLPPKASDLKPAREEPATQEVTASIVYSLPSGLEAVLDACGVSDTTARTRVAGNDLTGLPDKALAAICEWYAESCGLHPSEVCAMRVQGRIIPYVKASGVIRYAREKIKTVERRGPEFHGTVTVVHCTVTMKDGTVFQDFAARDGKDARTIMSCSTAATVRALRIACGIPLPSEGEI